MTTLPSQLGPYTIDRELGRGGMGVVYLGHDSKLDRPVAIKALPEHLAGEAERLARFEREAKLLASLTHPNIAGVYGLEEHEGARYLVMEFVEGESLAQIIERGPLAIDEAIRIAAQVASGVEAAHEAGVIHRDLKPGNIVVTPQGKAKVLDFGLAKEVEGRGSSLDLSHSPTATYASGRSPATAQGQIMGTAAYLSPEQARGKQLDKRTDIWSFGCVLYEMITGLSPFAGETATDSFGAILHKEPDWSRLPPSTPALVQLLLKRTLAKDPERRLRDIGDARVELEEALYDPSATSLRLAGAALEQIAPRKSRRGAIAAAFVVGLILAAGGMYAARPLLTPTTPTGPLRQVSLSLSEGVSAAPSFLSSMDLARDGSRVVFVGVKGEGRAQLFVRSFDQRDDVPLAGTESARNPIFSPDGQWIVFEQEEKLRKISIRGGPTTTLCDADSLTGMTWTGDGRIVFGRFDDGSLFSVGEHGGEPELLVGRMSESTTSFLIGPRAIPGGGIVYCRRESVSDFGSIWSLSPGETEPAELISNATFPLYSASGHLLFRRGRALMGAAFDAPTMELRGQPVPILEDVRTSPIAGTIHAAISADGTICFLEGEGVAVTDHLPFALSLSGEREALSSRPKIFGEPSASPDGTKLALTVFDPNEQFDGSIWILDVERDLLTLLTPEDGDQTSSAWSRDGRWVYYALRDRAVSGSFIGIHRRRSDGAGQPELVYESDRSTIVRTVLDDGSLLVTDHEGSAPNSRNDDLAIIDLSGEEPVRTPWLETPADEEDASLSPDGRWVAYNSDESGVEQVYVRKLDGGGGRVQVSRDGGSIPLWSPDGKTIYFIEDAPGPDRGSMMAALVLSDAAPASAEAEGAGDGDGLIRVGVPSTMLKIPESAGNQISMLPDGRFLLTDTAHIQELDTTEIHVILNFFQELERLAPTDRR